jgi:hypothetical protein
MGQLLRGIFEDQALLKGHDRGAPPARAGGAEGAELERSFEVAALHPMIHGARCHLKVIGNFLFGQQLIIGVVHGGRLIAGRGTSWTGSGAMLSLPAMRASARHGRLESCFSRRQLKGLENK